MRSFARKAVSTVDLDCAEGEPEREPDPKDEPELELAEEGCRVSIQQNSAAPPPLPYPNHPVMCSIGQLVVLCSLAHVFEANRQ